MAEISPISLTTDSVENVYNHCIEIINTQPTSTTVISPSKYPGQMVGYYNSTTDSVELYVVDGSGNRYLKVV